MKVTKTRSENVLIIGANSAIAREVARLFASRGANLWLTTRKTNQADRLSQDLITRGASSVHSHIFDVVESGGLKDVIDVCFHEAEHFDMVLIAYGFLPEQKECETSIDSANHAIYVNGTSVILIAGHIANYLERQQFGKLAVITSVAGDRGRKSNYVYGAAKGMISIFLSGLRDRLHSKKVHVIDIKPGFVDTPMTKHLPKGTLWAQPKKVAEDIVKAIDKNKSLCYTPWFWRWIMLVLLHIPTFIFRKLPI